MIKLISSLTVFSLSLSAFADSCSPFRWASAGPSPGHAAQVAMQLVEAQTEGSACFSTSFTELEDDDVYVMVSNALDSDYRLSIRDGGRAIFEDIVYAGTRDHNEKLPQETRIGAHYEVTVELINSTEDAVLTSTLSEGFEEGTGARLHVFRTSVIKLADTMRMDPTLNAPAFDELPLEKPE